MTASLHPTVARIVFSTIPGPWPPMPPVDVPWIAFDGLDRERILLAVERTASAIYSHTPEGDDTEVVMKSDGDSEPCVAVWLGRNVCALGRIVLLDHAG